MKTFLKLASFLFLAVSAWAQSTTVTAQITDSDGQTWNNGTYRITFVPKAGVPGPYNWSGGTLTTQFQGNLDNTGTFSISIPDNTKINPAGSQWQFTIAPNASAPAAVYTQPVSGTTANLSSQISAVAPVVRFHAGPGQYGYADLEVTPVPIPGGQYWNVSSSVLRGWTGSTWINIGSGGGGGGTTTGFISATDPLATGGCNLKGYPTDDTAALNICIAASTSIGKTIVFPKIVSTINLNGIACDYLFSGTILQPRVNTTPFSAAVGLLAWSTSWNDSVGLCWTADTVGIRINGGNFTISGFTMANTAQSGWQRGTLSTYGVPTTNHGIMICGGRSVVINSSLYYWSGDGVHGSSSDCTGPPTDFNTADKWQMNNVYINGVKGYGAFFGGNDGGVGQWINGSCTQNQLGCFADIAQYGNGYISINGDSNGSDPFAAVGLKTVTSCVETEGNTTCTITGHGFIENDWVTITGNSIACFNNRFWYIHVVDANNIQFPTGCSSGQTGTGGTAGYLPGARVWATNNLYAGAFVTKNAVGPTHLSRLYSEGTNGPAAPSFAVMEDPQGFISGPGGYYWANNGTSFARIGTINTIGSQPTIFVNGNFNTGFGFNPINPLSGFHAYSYFFPGYSAVNFGGGAGASDDCGWGTTDTSPYASLIGGHLSFCRYPHVSTASPGGYWALRSAANNGSVAFNALGFTDNKSTELDGYAVVFNGMIYKSNSAQPGFAGESTQWADTNNLLRWRSGTTESSPTYSSTVPVVNTAACIKAVGPPVQIGYCSTALSGSPPTCTCN